ncbi:hypothetical protein VTL71DRAFT_3335 [Oculimacula yallundae]|uniref:SH3 domain-containing protein n=1 Tax=Oculimacula yallundae TaxID=86028 RepID=A0ABR4C7H3_9HELO
MNIPPRVLLTPTKLFPVTGSNRHTLGEKPYEVSSRRSTHEPPDKNWTLRSLARRPWTEETTRTMGDDFVAPVKALLKALNAGRGVASRLAASANTVSAAQALQITEAARILQKSLDQSSQAVADAYRQNAATCGEPFTRTLVEDVAIQKQLNKARNKARDRIDDIEEDLESFDAETCVIAAEEAKDCSTTWVNVMNDVADRILAAHSLVVEKPRDDRAQLASMRMERSPTLRKPLPPTAQCVSPVESSRVVSPIVEDPPEPMKPKNPWAIDSQPQFYLGPPVPGIGSPPHRRKSSRDISPSSLPELIHRDVAHSRVMDANEEFLERIPEIEDHLIPSNVVRSRVDENEEFLERRRQSRLSFLNELRKSVSSNDGDKERKSYIDGPLIASPVLGSSGPAVSPSSGPRPSFGYGTVVTRQRSQASQGSRHSSIPERRSQRQDSQDSIFGLRSEPLSPPLSEHRTSGGTDTWGRLGEGALATTLQLPDFGKGVEPGLEVANGIDYDNEKIVVGSDEPMYNQPTPTASMKSIDYPIRHDTSFYKFGGFCEGSKAILRGENGLKVVKRPSGNYNVALSARCIKCSYEAGWNEVEKDRLLERSGIYGNSGIRWRQRFLSKCHLKTNSVEEPIYACVFCIDEHKTTEEHDATVFFSVSQLFRHLAKHQRPLPNIAGIVTLYGFQPPEVVDFDIHFTTPLPSTSAYGMLEISQKVATRPSGQATSTHHPKNTRSSSRDPEGNPVLKFANGARIVGITFPDRFGGKWCMGYHDGERGAFPASEIMLDTPAKEDVLMNPQSSLIATAKWEFKPKDTRDGGWLRFSKGDKISCIGYTFQDQWCWSGQSSKGKWGLFPAAFVENLQDGGGRSANMNIGAGAGARAMGTSPGSHRLSLSTSAGSRTGFGLSSRMPSFPLSRNRSSRQGVSGSNASVKSSGSGSNPNQQAGLEVYTGGMMR